MSDAFNPYAEWLGLADVVSRPNHYVLLGLAPFTADAQQVKQAADRAVTRVRGFRPGDKARYWATLLDEIDTARKCLCDDQSRRTYDAELRQRGDALASKPTGFAAGAAPNPSPVNPAMYPPGMGGAQSVRYGPAGPAPDEASQHVAAPQAVGVGVSRFAPGFDVAASSTGPLGPQPTAPMPGPAGRSAATTVNMPRRLPMSRDAGAATPSLDPMAPAYGMHPMGDPMAPVVSAHGMPTAQPYGTIPQAQVYQQPAYGAAAYGAPMQPVTAVPLHPTGGANPMAPVAMPLDAGGYAPANYSTGGYGSPYGQPAQGWGDPLGSSLASGGMGMANAAPLGAALPQLVTPAANPGGAGAKLLVAGCALAVLLALGGVVAFFVMRKGDSDDDKNVAAVDPDDDADEEDLPDEIKPPVLPPVAVEPDPTPEPTPPPTRVPPIVVPPPEPTPPPPDPQPDPPIPPEPLPPEPMPPEPAPPPMPTPQEKAALKQALAEARQAMTAADFSTARTKLAAAEQLARSDEQKELVARNQELEHYLEQFWGAFDKAYVALQPTGTLTIDTAEAAIVEVRADALVIKWFGRNRTIPRDDMPAGLVMAIANNWFNDDPANKVVKGAYYLINNKPDKAQQLWQEAGAAGQSVKGLLQLINDEPL